MNVTFEFVLDIMWKLNKTYKSTEVPKISVLKREKKRNVQNNATILCSAEMHRPNFQRRLIFGYSRSKQLADSFFKCSFTATILLYFSKIDKYVKPTNAYTLNHIRNRSVLSRSSMVESFSRRRDPLTNVHCHCFCATGPQPMEK